ncbi:MAG: YceI family protein [Candidatus Kapabacteria bacterium]|nr:YceI family protein [Candidatus Kapabacteria bacterium]
MPTTQWIADTMHSDVHFKVKHLMITTVTGTFASYTVDMKSDAPDFSDAKISFTADTASISTGLEQRDNHLKSDDFFNAEQFPQMRFTSTAFTKKSDSQYTLTGDLTIRDTTKSITLDVEFGGTMVDFYGNTKAGFEITGKLNRKEFGLKWDAVTEAGGVVVSDEVRLALNIQLQKVAA